MYGIEMKMWDPVTKKYDWEFIARSGSRVPHQFPSAEDAEQYVRLNYVCVVAADHLRVSLLR